MRSNSRILYNKQNEILRSKICMSPARLQSTKQATLDEATNNKETLKTKKDNIENPKENLADVQCDEPNQNENNKSTPMKLRKRQVRTYTGDFFDQSFLDVEYSTKKASRNKGKSNSRFYERKVRKARSNDMGYVKKVYKSKTVKGGPLENILLWKSEFENQPIHHEVENLVPCKQIFSDNVLKENLSD